MTKLEKTLAGLIGVFVLVMIVWSAISRISNSFENRQNAIARLDEEIARKNLFVREGEIASRKLAGFEQSSLPGDPALARSLYQAWLLEVAEEDVQMDGVNVGPLPGRPVSDVYYLHAFSLSCSGDLEQLIEFLHKFHGSGYLHRIVRLHVTPISKSKRFTLAITTEALSLNQAPSGNELSIPRVDRLGGKGLAEYKESILNRNVFSPANKAPSLASLGTQRGNPNQPLRFTATASDPENDALRYAFEGDALEGAEIDPKTGEVRWTPPENGEYQIAIRVTDLGNPPRSDTETIDIQISDPPPAPVVATVPGFDPATQAVVTGITEAFGQRKLFITVQTEGRILKLREGDPVEVGTVKGTVKRIGENEFEIETGDGKTRIVELGDSLVNDRA